MKFYCDTMLGRLAKQLRILGFDTVYHAPGAAEEMIHAASGQNRIILTRRTAFSAVDSKQVFIITSNHPKEQTREIIQAFNISRNEIHPFSLCVKCNTKLEEIKKIHAHGRVPEHIYTSTENFSRCSCCSRIYWRGTHLENTQKKVSDLFMHVG